MSSAAFEAFFQEIGWKSPFLSIQQPEIMKENIFFLTYCAEHAIYGFLKEDPDLSDMTWNEFIYTFESDQGIKKVAASVARKTIEKWFSSPDFVPDTEQKEFPIDENVLNPKTDKVSLAALFSDDVGRGLIETILLKIEMQLYQQVRGKEKGPSWEQFMLALSKDKSQWDDIMFALRNAIGQLDFRPVWIEEASE